MAPDMIDAKKQNANKIDIVLLNVDNSRWNDLIDKYDVNGIPKLSFFDNNGEFSGYFSPSDYLESKSLVKSLKSLKL